ncbi:Cytochrome c oxidase protein 20, mitochondrial [Wickerhamomyces ciferrii]|uniref:Cytochrome c oxidase assembly protein COX20, mitochondrial n=1 Tax=Wickerhamomyces ciferrii (strain ATCC 14091 / BCRC 22168 / CBS 111 / JCM 3599 / NBRC 0793 / NRRL Y-1031 F-60-10) TaxID=1206466 RepID=K0KL70_WICCF|nr:Cytochrome c oxidase protein 20, mitochondrial [Wickerhamomyces ciferrii]CCH42932.1 Cytochrome c oxidase protein 20, mitochondrial [Wickerhamomyces ciferrii]
MVWPFNKKEESKEEPKPVESSSSSIQQTRRSSAPRSEQPLLLEDTEPRFNNGPANPINPLKQAVDTIKADDFKPTSLVKIPCLREALMTGISALGVLGAVIFIAQKNASKAVNWGVGGFLLGSTVSWEQCRSKRRKEQAFAAKAREVVANKEKPMLHKRDDELKESGSREEARSWWKR